MALNRKMLVCSSLEKIFPDTVTVEIPLSSFSMLKNEKCSFQFAVEAKKGETVSFTVNSPLAEALHFYFVQMIPAGTKRTEEIRRLLHSERQN